MHRRLFQARKLEACVVGLLLALVALQRLVVRLGEAFPYGKPARRIVDLHEPPGLAEADRWRMGGDLDQPVELRRIEGVGTEAPHVAPPQHEIAELVAERRVENRNRHVDLRAYWRTMA